MPRQSAETAAPLLPSLLYSISLPSLRATMRAYSSGFSASLWSIESPSAPAGGGAIRLDSHWKAPSAISANIAAANSAAG